MFFVIKIKTKTMSSAAAAPITMPYDRLEQIRYQLLNNVLREIVLAHKLPTAEYLRLFFHCSFYFRRSIQYLKYYNLAVQDKYSCCYEHFKTLFRTYGGPAEGEFAVDYGKLGKTLYKEFEEEVKQDVEGRDRRNEVEIVDMERCRSMFGALAGYVLPNIKHSWGHRYVELECVDNPEGQAIMDEFILFFMEFTERLFGDAEFDFKAFCDAKVKECQAKVKAAEAEARRAAKAEAKAEAKAGGDAKRVRVA